MRSVKEVGHTSHFQEGEQYWARRGRRAISSKARKQSNVEQYRAWGEAEQHRARRGSRAIPSNVGHGREGQAADAHTTGIAMIATSRPGVWACGPRQSVEPGSRIPRIGRLLFTDWRGTCSTKFSKPSTSATAHQSTTRHNQRHHNVQKRLIRSWCSLQTVNRQETGP